MYCTYCPECGEELGLGNVEARGAGYSANAHHFFFPVYRHRLNDWLDIREKDTIDLGCHKAPGQLTRIQRRPMDR